MNLKVKRFSKFLRVNRRLLHNGQCGYNMQIGRHKNSCAKVSTAIFNEQ